MFYGIGKQVLEMTKLAFGLIRSELLIVVGLCILTSIVPALKVYDPELMISQIAYLSLVERLVQLSALFVILERWRR